MTTDDDFFKYFKPAEPLPWTPTPPLTIETLRTAMRIASEMPYTVCVGGDQHLVHPLDFERGGYAPCAGCGTIVDLGSASSP